MFPLLRQESKPDLSSDMQQIYFCGFPRLIFLYPDRILYKGNKTTLKWYKETIRNYGKDIYVSFITWKLFAIFLNEWMNEWINRLSLFNHICVNTQGRSYIEV